MMNVVICDDEIYDQEALLQAAHDWMKTSSHQDVHFVTYTSSEDFLEAWEKGLSVDLLFLDIQIPGEMNGMRLAQRIRQKDQNILIVFVTNYDHYIYDGYAVNALRYLQKPISNEDMAICMDIAYRHASFLTKEGIKVDTKDESLVLKFSEIVYIEACLHYLRLFLDTSQAPLEIRAHLQDFVSQLPARLFIQCHRSYVVNLEHIRRLTKSSVTLSNQQIIPVSQTYFLHLRDAFGWYYTGSKFPV
ncbi:MAG: LytTR family DNA-binding domain-containing protein, partial [Acinetobacter sp.]